jgi:hypothetical protein
VLVENQDKLIYARVFVKIRKLRIFDLASLNEVVLEKVRQHRQTRMLKKPNCTVERFLALEKPVLRT